MSALSPDENIAEPRRPIWRKAGPGCHRASGSVSDLVVASSLAAVEPLWRDLEIRAPHSVYQRFDFCRAWQSHVGAASDVTPLVVTGLDRVNGQRFLLPLGTRRRGPLRLAGFLGGKHANYKFGLFEGKISSEALRHALAEAGARARIDAFVFFDQPSAWADRGNPLLQGVASWPAPARTWRASLDGGFDPYFARTRGASARKRLRWRRRKLGEAGPLHLARAGTQAEAIDILERFLSQKRARFAGRMRRNAFEDDATMAFLHDLAASTGRPDAALDTFALMAGDRVVATFGGGAACGHFSGCFISIDDGESSRFGPGEVILADVLHMLCDEGIGSFDLGIGDSAYKALWCEPETLRDTVVPVTMAGHGVAPLVRAARRAKARLKRDLQTETQIAGILANRTAAAVSDACENG